MRDRMTQSSGEARDPLVREAVDLWLRLRASPQDSALLAEVGQWRRQSPAHERAFAATEETWTLAGEMEGRAAPFVTARPHRRRGRGHHRRRMAAAVAGAAATACLAVVTVPSLVLLWQSDYRTGTGEKQTVGLADGSSVTLDTGSAIALDYKDGRRGVRLLAGRAWFDVAKDKAHPFTVSAAEARVTVTGTAFDVGLADSAIDVALARGGVRVNWEGAAPVTMTPGDVLHIARPSHVTSRGQSGVSSMGSWRRDRLLLENVTLADGIAQLRRYYSGAIILTSASLGQRRVTGVFDVRTPDDALRLMVRQHGATVREITPWLLIVSGG